MNRNLTSRANFRPDYGIDAPAVRRGMLLAGRVGIATTVFIELANLSSLAAKVFMVISLIVATYGLFMGSYMTYSSLVGKLHTREKLLDMAASLRSFKGDERILDVGCGRGLMTVGAARRIKSGIAVGIDVWRAEDQANNSPEAAVANARGEGVADRVRIVTADARDLPYADSSFDLVLSHWVIHNLPGAADRQRVLDEMLRVLCPGGVFVIADIANVEEYRTHLLSKGISKINFLSGGLEAAIMGTLSGGSYRPQALVGVRP